MSKKTHKIIGVVATLDPFYDGRVYSEGCLKQLVGEANSTYIHFHGKSVTNICGFPESFELQEGKLVMHGKLFEDYEELAGEINSGKVMLSLFGRILERKDAEITSISLSGINVTN
tara:strand:+ start:2580 stop:2927 length:348 start_codon:yes stop_codon:yes gene_type:complete